MTKATLAQASAWLLALRVPFANNETSTESKLVVRPIAASMIKTYDADAFRAESKEAVGATLKWFREPDIRERLDVWVRINAPETVQTLAPEAAAAPISDMGKWSYSRFLKAGDDSAAVRALDTLRDRDRSAFDWVVRHDHGAASHAVMRGWQPTPTREELARDWDDEDGIRGHARRVRSLPRSNRSEAMIQDQAMNTLLMAVKINAPQHFDALVDALRAYAEPESVPVAFVEEVTLFGEL